MYILAIDTTAKTAAACVALLQDGVFSPVCSSALHSTLTHSESILPMIDYCLKNADLSVKDVDCFAVSAGPGSFTGVRIGISTVKGLAFANQNAMCIPVSALEALAANLDDSPKGTVICACMDARRNQVYNALFLSDGNGNIKRLCEDRAIAAEELFSVLREKYSKKKIKLVGDGACLAYKLFTSYDGFSDMKIDVARGDRLLQDAVSVARVAAKRQCDSINAGALNPVYLRLSQAERERNERMENK